MMTMTAQLRHRLRRRDRRVNARDATTRRSVARVFREAAVTETATAEREDLAEKASEFLLGVLERMGISADIDIKDDKDKTVLEIQTSDTELVIGRRGVVMDALQHLVNKAVYKDRGDRDRDKS